MNWRMTIDLWEEILPQNEIKHVKEMISTDQGEISSNEIFKALLEYEGIIGYDFWLKCRIAEIYGEFIDKECIE